MVTREGLMYVKLFLSLSRGKCAGVHIVSQNVGWAIVKYTWLERSFENGDKCCCGCSIRWAS